MNRRRWLIVAAVLAVLAVVYWFRDRIPFLANWVAKGNNAPVDGGNLNAVALATATAPFRRAISFTSSAGGMRPALSSGVVQGSNLTASTVHVPTTSAPTSPTAAFMPSAFVPTAAFSSSSIVPATTAAHTISIPPASTPSSLISFSGNLLSN